MLPATKTGTTALHTNIEQNMVRLQERKEHRQSLELLQPDHVVTDVEYAVINIYSDSADISNAEGTAQQTPAAMPTLETISPNPRCQPQKPKLSEPLLPLSSVNHKHSGVPLCLNSSLESQPLGMWQPSEATLDDNEDEMDDESDDGYSEFNNVAAGENSNNALLCRVTATPAANEALQRVRGGGINISSPRNAKYKDSTCSSPKTSPTPQHGSTLGVNMRVTGQCSQGGRKYMEDQFSVAYQESPVTHELEYAFFGIYDGHGGTEAALFAKEHLMLEIVKQKLFWSENDEDVLRAIREGYIATHFAMWREQEKWPRTANGHLSTAGTTATVAFMRREKIYIGHVGDSGIVLGYQNGYEHTWRAKQLTTDHKPESQTEKARIQRAGGNVAIKSGVPRVVWNRPRDPFHRGPIKQRTQVDDIPFLAVARSLGDLWSYNSRSNEFVVSPDPDVKVVKINPKTFRCLIFGTDGLWNVVTPQEAVDNVRERHIIGECLREQDVMNPSKSLVDKALKTWSSKKMRADNTSVVTVILTPALASSEPSNGFSDEDTEIMMESQGGCSSPLLIEDYSHDMPYSVLAKRYLPPEAYRNFDYFEEEDSDDGAAAHNVSYMETDMLQQSLSCQSKLWRKSRYESKSTAWNCNGIQQPVYSEARDINCLNAPISMTNLLDIVDVENDDEDDEADLDEEIDDEVEDPESPEGIDLDMYSNNVHPAAYVINEAHVAAADSNSGDLAELERHLEHSFQSYGNTSATGTDYSFAESYNSLLNEQQAARNRSAVAATATPELQLQNSSSRSMQDILQEQQRYRQQEGYSLTRLETRREQQQAAAITHNFEAQQPANVTAAPWPQTEYVSICATAEQQTVELLELDALLQQEREEEHRVALEQQQQQHLIQQQASSSSPQQYAYAETEWSDDSAVHDSELKTPNAASYTVASDEEPTLQDNEVSSTLPATPPEQPINTLQAIAEMRKEDAHAVHYIYEQIQKLEEVKCSSLVTRPAVELLATTTPLVRRRQMRRYRNVPNENHQHMQTRRRQKFKRTRSRSFIAAGAAAIVAFSNDTIPSCSSNGVGASSTGTSCSRRSVNSNINAASSSHSIGTRRSHNLSIGAGVNKRQLRSSLCSLDITKRTLRTRNAPSMANSVSGNVSASGSNSTTFPRPVATSVVTRAASRDMRAPRRSNEELLASRVEQRRSLRRSTMTNNNVNASNSCNGGGFSKPTRQQSSSGGIAARPPPSPKKLNTASPTLAIGTRAYTAAMAAASELNKRWSLRSSSGTITNRLPNPSQLNRNSTSSLLSAVHCYGAKARANTRKR